jgi:futalosine hydrolase
MGQRGGAFRIAVDAACTGHRVPDLLIVAATELELRVAGDLAPTLCCGIGPIEAAVRTAAALSRNPPSAVLHVGVAGARADSGIDVGRLVLGSEAVYEDIAGDLAARVPRIERVLPDEGLLSAASVALPDALLTAIGTTARVGAGQMRPVEAMEGFAVLRAAELAGVPAVELRAISNLVEDDRDAWRLDDALQALAVALPRVISALAALRDFA